MLYPNMNNSQIKKKFFINKQKKNTTVGSWLKKRNSVSLSKNIFCYKLNLLKNKQNITTLVAKKLLIKNLDKEKRINTLLNYLVYLKNRKLENGNKFYKTNILLTHFYSRLISFHLANEYLITNLLKNLNNYPYSILIAYLNRSIRFWFILKLLLHVFISEIKVSQSNYFSKISDSREESRFLNPSKKISVTTSKNKMKARLWEIKGRLLAGKMPDILIKNCSKNELYNRIKLSKKNLSTCDLKWFYFHKKVIRLVSVGNLFPEELIRLKLINLKKQSFTKIKYHLWKMNRKLHTQNSFNWLFKKYWLILNSYKYSSSSLKINRVKSKNLSSLLRSLRSREEGKIFKTKNLIFFKNVLRKETWITNSIISTRLPDDFVQKLRKMQDLNSRFHSDFKLFTYYLI